MILKHTSTKMKKNKFLNTFMNSKTTAAFYHSIYEIFLVCPICVCAFPHKLVEEIRLHKVSNLERSDNLQSLYPSSLQNSGRNLTQNLKQHETLRKPQQRINIFHSYFSQSAFLCSPNRSCDRGLKKISPPTVLSTAVQFSYCSDANLKPDLQL